MNLLSWASREIKGGLQTINRDIVHPVQQAFTAPPAPQQQRPNPIPAPLPRQGQPGFGVVRPGAQVMRQPAPLPRQGQPGFGVMRPGAVVPPQKPAPSILDQIENSVKGIVQGTVNPASKFANDVVAAGKLVNPAGTIASNQRSAAQQLQPGHGIGHQGGVLQGRELSTKPVFIGPGSMQNIKSTVGTGVQLGTTFAAPGAGLMQTGSVAARIAKGAAVGAGIGAGGSVGQQLADTGKVQLKPTLQGAAMGAVLGGGAPAIHAAIPVVKDNLPNEAGGVPINPERALNTIHDYHDVLQGNKPKVSVANITPELSQRIQKEAGVFVKPNTTTDLSKGNAIHIEQRHGVSSPDPNPVNDKAIGEMPYVLENPDRIIRGATVRGAPRVRLERQLSDNRVGVVEIIKKGNGANVVTYFNDSPSGRPGVSLPQDIRPGRNQSANNSILPNQKGFVKVGGRGVIPAPGLPKISGGRTTTPRTQPSQKIPAQSQLVQPGKTEMQAAPLRGVPSVNNTMIRQRGLTTSVKNSKEISPELQKMVNSTYTPSNLAEKALTADRAINRSLKGTTNKVIDTLSKPTQQLTDQDAAHAIAAMKANDAKGNLAEAQHIHDLLAEHGTQHGQFINAFKLLSNRTPDGMLFSARRALTKAGITLDKAGQDELKAHVSNVKATVAGTPERDMAIHNMIQFVQKRIPSSAGDKVVNFWRAGLLTSPITTGGNILGNAGEALVRNLYVNPVATAADKLQSIVTHTRTKTLAGGQTKGAVQGGKDAITYLKTGFDKNNPLTKIEGKSDINYGSSPVGKAVGKYVNGVYRGLGAQDKPFRGAAQSQAARDLAKADAKNLGYKGQTAKDYIAQSVANPDWKPQTFKTANDAPAAGAFSVFANETALGKVAQLVKQPFTINGKTFNGGLRQFILPFSQVPASIAMRIIRRSDLGVTEIVNQILRVRKGIGYDQRAVSEAIGNGTFGPAAIGAGYALSKSGNITGNYPTDPKERALWASEGKQANSVKIGNRWYSLNYMQPFGTLLGIGDQIHQDEKAGKSPQDIVSNAAARAAKSVESQSFLQGINGVLGAVNDPQQNAKTYVNTTASSVVPNFVRTAARATDPLQRDTGNVVDALKGTIPGVRETLPAKQDMFGAPLKAPDNPVNQAFNPLRPSLAKTGDPVVTELRHLQDSNNGIIPTQFDKNAISGAKLTDQQVRELNTTVNSRVHDAWSKIIADPRYQQLSEADKATALKKAKDQIGAAYKREFSAKNNIEAGLKKPASTTSAAILSGNQPDYIASAQTSVGAVNPKLDKQSKDTLTKYPNDASRKQAFTTDKTAEYNYAKAKYNNDKLNGKLTKAQDIKAQDSLAKLKVGAGFDPKIRDLYSLSSTDLQKALKNDPNATATQDALNKYDAALASAGAISSPKYTSNPMDTPVTKVNSAVETYSTVANKYGIPPQIFAALIKQESGGNQNARSPVGAIGLTQLMPDTARGLGVDPYDAKQNLEGGAKYLAAQYQKFGRWDYALAAYNAGPGAVSQYGGVPPYAETQNYVKNILGMASSAGGKNVADILNTLNLNNDGYTYSVSTKGNIVAKNNATGATVSLANSPAAIKLRYQTRLPAPKITNPQKLPATKTAGMSKPQLKSFTPKKYIVSKSGKITARKGIS